MAALQDPVILRGEIPVGPEKAVHRFAVFGFEPELLKGRIGVVAITAVRFVPVIHVAGGFLDGLETDAHILQMFDGHLGQGRINKMRARHLRDGIVPELGEPLHVEFPALGIREYHLHRIAVQEFDERRESFLVLARFREERLRELVQEYEPQIVLGPAGPGAQGADHFRRQEGDGENGIGQGREKRFYAVEMLVAQIERFEIGGEFVFGFHGHIIPARDGFEDGGETYYNMAMNPTYIILGVAAVILGYVVAAYNRLATPRVRTREALSDIDVQTKRRYALIPNLVETVKGYMTHEIGR